MLKQNDIVLGPNIKDYYYLIISKKNQWYRICEVTSNSIDITFVYFNDDGTVSIWT